MATKTITVLNGQQMPDIALQYYGVIDGIWDIANLNNISYTEYLVPGQQLLVTVVTNETTKYLGSEKDKPTFVVAASYDPSIFQGIGYWFIGDDFIVQ